jgi:hypothetical protein
MAGPVMGHARKPSGGSGARQPSRSEMAGREGWYAETWEQGGAGFVTPVQSHTRQAISICRDRAQVYEQDRQLHPRHWSRSTHCWRQPEVVWIKPPPPEGTIFRAKMSMAV